MGIRFAVLLFFGVLFYMGVFRLPEAAGLKCCAEKDLPVKNASELLEFGEIDTLLVQEKTVIDEEGELDKEAIEIVTMIGRSGIETVLMTEQSEAAADEIARRLGAVKTYWETTDYMDVIAQMEKDGKKVLYAEDLWTAEESVELGRMTKNAIKTNGFWTIACGIAGIITASNPAVVFFAIANIAALALTTIKFKKL